MLPPQLSVAPAVAAQAATAAGSKHCKLKALPGTVTTGRVVSLTVKSLVAVPTFPQLSVAVNVTVTVWLQLLAGSVERRVGIVFRSQLSVALAVADHAATGCGEKQ